MDAYSKSELDDRDADDVLTVLEELNVAEYAQEVTRQRADRALEELDCVVPLSSWARREIEDLVDFPHHAAVLEEGIRVYAMGKEGK